MSFVVGVTTPFLVSSPGQEIYLNQFSTPWRLFPFDQWSNSSHQLCVACCGVFVTGLRLDITSMTWEWGYNLYDLGMRLCNLYDLGMRLYNLYDLGMRIYITSGGLTRPVWGTRLPLRIILATMAAGLPTAWAIAVNPLGVPYIVRLMCLVSCGKQMWPTYTHNRVYRESCDQPRVLRWLGTAKFVKVYNHVARFSCFRGTSSSLAFKVLLHPYILTLGRSAPPGAEKALR